MRTISQILGHYKETVKRRFFEVLAEQQPLPAKVPAVSLDALQLGISLGRKEGYSLGLIDGTRLGMAVSLDAVDEMLCQPVILGTPADA